MGLREAALAAYRASASGRESDARAVLAGVLAPEDVSGLVVADVAAGQGFARFVFTDSDLCLAVILRSAGEDSGSPGDSVHLVSGSPGGWTDLAAVTSLAQLGSLLPGLAPTDPPGDGPAAWAPGTAYAVGDEVAYAGATYTCLQAHQSQVGWEPPAVPALWKVA